MKKKKKNHRKTRRILQVVGRNEFTSYMNRYMKDKDCAIHEHIVDMFGAFNQTLKSMVNLTNYTVGTVYGDYVYAHREVDKIFIDIIKLLPGDCNFTRAIEWMRKKIYPVLKIEHKELKNN